MLLSVGSVGEFFLEGGATLASLLSVTCNFRSQQAASSVGFEISV